MSLTLALYRRRKHFKNAMRAFTCCCSVLDSTVRDVSAHVPSHSEAKSVAFVTISSCQVNSLGFKRVFISCTIFWFIPSTRMDDTAHTPSRELVSTYEVEHPVQYPFTSVALAPAHGNVGTCNRVVPSHRPYFIKKALRGCEMSVYRKSRLTWVQPVLGHTYLRSAVASIFGQVVLFFSGAIHTSAVFFFRRNFCLVGCFLARVETCPLFPYFST